MFEEEFDNPLCGISKRCEDEDGRTSEALVTECVLFICGKGAG